MTLFARYISGYQAAYGSSPLFTQPALIVQQQAVPQQQMGGYPGQYQQPANYAQYQQPPAKEV